MASVKRSEAPVVTDPPPVAGLGANGSWNAVATSRARPITLRQSGRFAVTSKSTTSFSTDATSNPRSPIFPAISSAEAFTSTKSRNHERTRRMRSVLELLEEAQVVLVEEPDVFDLVFEDGDALDADAPREARVPLGVVADGFEDGRMHHAAAAELDPAGLLAHRAAAAVALPAAQVDLRARLGVREEARTEPHPRRRREHLLREREQRAFEIRERESLADREPFNLSESGGVRQVEVVAAVHTAGRDDPDRRLVRLHVPDLDRRGVRAQQRADVLCVVRAARDRLREIERVLHVAR